MVRTVTMADLLKNKPPPSPKDSHRDNVGKGTYNRWEVLNDDPGKNNTLGKGKRPLEGSPTAPAQATKTIRLDPNKIFQDMQVHEEKLKAAKTTLEEAKTLGDEKDIFAAGPMGSVMAKMLVVLTALVSQQEDLTSAVIDICKVSNNTNMASGGQPAIGEQGQRTRTATFSNNNAKQVKKQPTSEELHHRKIKQEIAKAERSTILFDLDLGSVPIINKETLSSKVTYAIHAAATDGPEVAAGNYSSTEAQVMLDDILTCASLEFLGNGSRKYHNQKNSSDPKNGKFCTIPAKLTFRTKDERIRAEQAIRKLCKVRCAIPYPKKLRGMVNTLIQEGRAKSPGNYIQVKVDTENMKLSVRASIKQENDRYSWEDLKMDQAIPDDVLDKYTHNAEGDVMDLEIS
jgi:hypothetical protein